MGCGGRRLGQGGRGVAPVTGAGTGDLAARAPGLGIVHLVLTGQFEVVIDVP